MSEERSESLDSDSSSPEDSNTQPQDSENDEEKEPSETDLHQQQSSSQEMQCNSNSEAEIDINIMEGTGHPEHPSEDMMHMFASVWVKVEVKEEASDYSPEVKVPAVTLKSRKYTPRRPPTQILTCDICQYQTPYKNCLNNHIRAHDSARPFECTYCGYATKYQSALYRHLVNQHNVRSEEHKPLGLFKCDQCDYETNFKYNLKAHKRKHSDIKQFQCPHCPYNTAYRHNYLKHSKTHNKKEVTYKCDKCPFITKFEGHITRHLAKIHNEVSERANLCDYCDFSTITRWRLNIHLQRSKQTQILKCPYCPYETMFMCAKKKHRTIHYNEIFNLKNVNKPQTEETPTDARGSYSEINLSAAEFEAYRNDTWFTRGVELIAQTSATQEPKNLENPNVSEAEKEYDNGFANNSSSEQSGEQSQHAIDHQYLLDPNCEVVDWHSIQVLECPEKEKPFQCLQCKYDSKFKASVQRHFQRHHTSKNRPYKCLKCDFSTKTKDQISLHNKRSKSDGILVCNKCPYQTNFKCQFAMHQKCHYTHKCSSCDYSCKSKYDIQRHYAVVHLGDGMKCHYCEFRAMRKESLLCHETIHTGNKPFKCMYCTYQSVRKSLLEKHIGRYHRDLVQNNMVIIDDSKIESLKVTENYTDNAPLPESEPSTHYLTGEKPVKPFKCTYCKFRSIRKLLLDKHLERFHGELVQRNMVMIKDSKIEALKVSESYSEVASQ